MKDGRMWWMGALLAALAACGSGRHSPAGFRLPENGDPERARNPSVRDCGSWLEGRMVSAGSESAPWEGTSCGPRAGWVSLAAWRGGPAAILEMQGQARA